MKYKINTFFSDFQKKILLKPFICKDFLLAKLKIFHYSEGIDKYIHPKNDPVCFVPTMGALHQGHIDLVNEALKYSTNVWVSVFVNPKQFNNPEDFEKYPIKTKLDLQILDNSGTSAVFLPTKDTVYPENSKSIQVDISPLDSVFEGHYRQGHFDGVIQVLNRLFLIIKPQHVFFGQKDLQQCLVVEKLIEQHFPSITMHIVPTRRETSGLALSSRNLRLSEAGKAQAAQIYQAMNRLKADNNYSKNAFQLEIDNLKDKSNIETEYFDLVHLPNMTPTSSIMENQRYAIVYAGYLEGVRLIDNLYFET